MVFLDRDDAGRMLGNRVRGLSLTDPVVLALPRGGVPVGYRVALALAAPLDVIVVRKLGVPFQPELAMGAIGEDSVRVLDAEVVEACGIGVEEISAIEARERLEVLSRARRYRAAAPRVPLEGRTAVVVDDGMATGSTARAACLVARAQGAAVVVMAVPVASTHAVRRLGDATDWVVALEQPEPFFAVGQWYLRFGQTSDAEVLRLLSEARGARSHGQDPRPPGADLRTGRMAEPEPPRLHPPMTPTPPASTGPAGMASGLQQDVTLRPIAWVFVLFGVFWGGWAVAAIDIEHELGLTTGGFGLLLSVSLAGSVVANAVGGGLCQRFGTSRVLGLALASWAVFLVIGSAVRTPVGLGLAIVFIVVNAGLIDVTINVASLVALADEPGRLVAFHSRFNAGAAGGAALMGGLLAAHISWRWVWVAVAVLSAVLALVCSRSPIPGAERGEQVPWHGALTLLREERLIVLAGVFALAAMVEGGIDLWGVLFLRSQLDSGLLLGAGGAVLGYSVAAVARSVLGPSVGRRGPPRGVMIGAGTAAIGCLLLTVAPTAAVGALGLVLAAGGISMCWPLLVAMAGRGRERGAAAVGAVTAGGYLGLVAGPALVGWMANVVGLRAALGLLAAAAAIVAAIPAFRPRLLVGRAPAS